MHMMREAIKVVQVSFPASHFLHTDYIFIALDMISQLGRAGKPPARSAALYLPSLHPCQAVSPASPLAIAANTHTAWA